MILFNNTNMRTAMAYTNAVGDKVYPIIVDIKKGIKSTEEILFVSSDINTGILSVAFIQGNDTYNVAGAEVVCSVMRPDTTTLEIPCNIVNDNIVEVPLGVNGTSQDGIYSFDFKVFKGGNKVVGTPIMNYSVSLSISNDNVVLEDDRLPVLTMLMTQVTELKDEARESINQANTATEATKVATANAIEATNNVNAVINTANQKMVEVDNAKNEMTATVTNKVNEVEGRFNALTASQQQSSEVIDARDGETSLKARLDRDIEKAKQVYVDVEGSHISTDSSSGYAKDVEILGNTIQDASNLADIRSVGDTVEGQELYEIPVVSCGKNLINPNTFKKGRVSPTGVVDSSDWKYVIVHVSQFDFVTVSNIKWLSEGVLCRVLNNSESSFLGNVGMDRGFVTLDVRGYDKLELSVKINSTVDDRYIQLEEGTVATEYEPYQEDKLTILSPVQLEKVGDVADRIICKDGVWGVEKNIVKDRIFGNNIIGGVGLNDKTFDVAFKLSEKALLHQFNGTSINDFSDIYSYARVDNEHYYIENDLLIIFMDKNKFAQEVNIENVKKYFNINPINILYIATPQFIPLPHDQQIKLRTFANKTNISFGCEIEGTIKAQVPKSLGATVNTHTEQISNLNKELDKIKKLEESTVSTVTTESDFTTVEATSNGYFEDVKLEGKTLVNLSTLRDKTLSNANNDERRLDFNTSMFKASTDYTLIMNVGNVVNGTKSLFVQWDFIDGSASKFNTINSNVSSLANSTVVFKFRQDTLPSELKRVYLSLHINDSTSCTCEIKDCIVLEGDHTQNPPSYFEGLKSVGQSASEDGADEIVVSSVGENLHGTLYATNKYIAYTNPDMSLINNPDYDEYFIPVAPGESYTIQYNEIINAPGQISNFVFADYNKNKITGIALATTLTVPTNAKYMFYAVNHRCTNVKIEKGNIATDYTPHQSDKKRLLYYNNETQTWENPILREWDSIEKHADGKYYYHQRSGEVVLNGSEEWHYPESQVGDNTILLYSRISDAKINQNYPICDRFNGTYLNIWDSTTDIEGILINHNKDCILRINKSKLSTQDVAGFKKWLQANNVTVVYQLAEEKVYECTNIDLITYNGETNYVVESGAIVPKTTLKVHNNISNIVKILQEKVSLLENKFIEGLRKVLAGDMYSLAELLYPEDFVEENPEHNIMLLSFE